MFTRRGFIGTVAAALSLGGIRGRRAPAAEWSVHEDADLAFARKLLDPFRGRFFLDPQGGETHWAIVRWRNHNWIVLHADVVTPVDKARGKFLTKSVVFLWQELKCPRAAEGIARRLARVDKERWRTVGLYEDDKPIYEDDGAFKSTRWSSGRVFCNGR